MKKTLLISIIILGIYFPQKIFAQADEISNFCSNFLPPPYISDGQQYRTLLVEDEIAEFRATFYGGATYRIVACSGTSEGNLIFRLYDAQRNELFESSRFNNTQYWDFKFNSTVDCIIEAELKPSSENSGFAIIMIGFK